MTLPKYATIDMVRDAQTSGTPSTRDDSRIWRALDSASRSVESLCHRKFYPWTGTRYFEWPDRNQRTSYRLWLEDDELISVSSLVSAGQTLTAYFLEPNDAGPPYDRIEIDRSATQFWSAGSTPQRSIAVTGDFGADSTFVVASTLAEILDTTETGIDLTDGSSVGVGSTILVGTERMLVIDKQLLTTGQTLQTPMTAANNNVTVAVTDGTAFHVNETIVLDAEKMVIQSIAGNNLLVERAWVGSPLGAHTGSTIYAYRSMTVERAVLGTTAATHALSDPVYRHSPPGLIVDLTIGETISRLSQEVAKYAKTAGSGDNQRIVGGGPGLDDLRSQVRSAYGRVRIRAS